MCVVPVEDRFGCYATFGSDSSRIVHLSVKLVIIRRWHVGGCLDVNTSCRAQTTGSKNSRMARGARFCCAAPRGMRGFPDAAVACLGAGGGVLSPGTKSKIGRIFSSTLLRSASCLPSGRGIHVPDSVRPARMPCACMIVLVIHTLIFPVSTLDLLVYTLLHLALKNPSPAGLVILRDFQDVGSVDPIVRSSSHAVVTFAVEFIDGYL
jgi:hypothetical protein